MAAVVTYEASTRPESEVLCLYRVLTIDGNEVNRTMVGLEEVLAADAAVAAEYKLAVQTKLDALVQIFQEKTEFDSELHEKTAIAMQTLSIFLGNYSDNMLPPVGM